MIKLKYGNAKIGDDTLIFNMSSAQECPAKSQCKVADKCYALKAETLYKDKVINYRNDQKKYWLENDAQTILNDIAKKICARRKTTKFFRFNEAGDFHSQECVDKLSAIADGLKKIDIVTYGYTARADLNFNKKNFLVKGSSNNAANNGKTTVINKNDSVPDGYILCPGNCTTCNLCKIDYPHNIAFRKH